MKKRSWLAAGLFACAWGVQAAPAAVVDAVQAPAWLERGGVRQPLAPGMELQNRDRLLTGPGARLVVQLADGTALKLGENARAGLNALGRRDGGVFTAAVDVAAGAFRLSTDSFRKARDQRAINVRAGSVTAGIRGTDIWGRSDGERDVVCLLEGRITVSHPQGEAAELDDPRQCYGAGKGQPPEPVAVVEPEQAALWAGQVELREDAGTLRRGGRWSVRLAVADSEAQALTLYDRFRDAGQAVKIRPRRDGDGQYRYELRIEQVGSETAARLLEQKLARGLEPAAPLALSSR